MEEQYQTIARQLLAEIEGGSFAIGKPLPTRAELAQRFKVARATMDRAVTLLVKRGVLESSRGSGTFVSEPGRDYQIALIGGGGLQALSSVQSLRKRSLSRIPFKGLEGKSARASLSRFDGLIWICPEERQMAWSAEIGGKVPQILVNRHLEEFNYVSTDHRGAIRQITAERIADWPDALPFFICVKGVEGLVWGMREEGFVDACRDSSRFYEILPLPKDFNAAVNTLHTRFKTLAQRRSVLVSGSLGTSGAIMTWAREAGVRWGSQIRYSDFDNEYPENVWGVNVTSFIQDYELLISEAIEGLVALIDGREKSVRKLVMPRRVEGQT